MGDGRQVVPLLQPNEDSLPFAMALELYKGPPGAAPGSSEELPPQPGLYQLQYVMDGRGQLGVQSTGEVEELRAGDMVLLQHGAASCTALGEQLVSSDGEAEPYEMAALSLFVPEELIEGHEDGAVIDTRAVQRAAARWLAAPVLGQLSHRLADDVLAGARETAHLTLPSPPPSSRPRNAAPHDPAAATSSQFDLRNDQAPSPPSHPETATSSGRSSGDPSHVGSNGMGRSGDGSNGSGQQFQESGRGAGGEEESSSGQAVGPEELVAAGAAALMWGAELAGDLVQRISAKMRSLRGRGELSSSSVTSPLSEGAGVVRRQLSQLRAFRLPHQSNRLALAFDPLADPALAFILGFEVFEPGHETTPHTHPRAHELFFILAGEGEAFCDDDRFPVGPGDVVVFPPRTVHGIDNTTGARMYALELMLPNDMFAEFVRQGQPTGSLDDDDLCVLISVGCGAGGNTASIQTPQS